MTDAGIARTPKSPYYAVIFTSIRTPVGEGYPETAERMLQLAAQQPGYLGVESTREGALGITVSYWQDLQSIKSWKAVAEHRLAQRLGRERWYRAYKTRICRVEDDYDFARPA
jgi:heme-degrading monooxygenase HmoA